MKKLVKYSLLVGAGFGLGIIVVHKYATVDVDELGKVKGILLTNRPVVK